MEYNSTPLPVGKKFFPLAGKEDHLNVTFASVMKKESIDIIKTALSTQKDLPNNEYWEVRSPMSNWEVLTDEEYPVIQMGRHALFYICYQLNTVNGTKKGQYASSRRINTLDIPVPNKTIKVQYDPVRKGLIVHDCPYEGELVGNKPMVVNKALKSLLNERVGEIELLALLGGDSKIGLEQNPTWGSKNDAGELIANILPKLYDNTYSEHDVALVSGAMGRFVVNYNHGTYNRSTGQRSAQPVDTKYNYYLDTAIKYKGTSTYDFSASVRTKLIYHFGGYTLPDNYEEWFDG